MYREQSGLIPPHLKEDGESSAGFVEIPSSFNGMPVTGIEPNMSYNSAINGGPEEFVIPASVTQIGNHALVHASIGTSSNLKTIYCEAESKPEGWPDDWIESDVEVVWGYTGK